MESKIKHVKIKDGGNVKEFTIRLFGALEGIDFIDKFLGDLATFAKGGTNMQGLSIRKFMGELLPLATILDGNGKPLDTMSLEKVDNYFENPLAPIELAMKILEHQMVFTNESEVFQQFKNTLQNTSIIKTSDSATQSETSSIQE